MKRFALLMSSLLVFATLSGMNCQGTTTTQPACETNCTPTPDGSLVIKSVAADAVKDQLLISGEFGDQQGSVSINGTTLNVVKWGPANPKPQQVICDLPREAYGNVQVQVGTRFSNIAQLTKWELTLVSKTTITATAPSSGEHHIDITATFIIRSCLNNLLGSAEPFGSFASVSRASTALFDASGSITNPAPPGGQTQTITLSKQDPQDFKVVYPGDPTDFRFGASNFVCGATRGSGGGIKLLFSISGFYKVTEQLGGTTNVGEHATGYATNTYFDTAQPVLFFFDGGFNIVGGSATAKSDPNSTLEWQQAGAQSPPTN